MSATFATWLRSAARVPRPLAVRRRGSAWSSFALASPRMGTTASQSPALLHAWPRSASASSTAAAAWA